VVAGAKVEPKTTELNGSLEQKKTKEEKKKAKANDRTFMDFLDLEIAEQARELECPVCLEESPPDAPIYMCEELHPVCSTCRPRLKVCPSCRLAYPAWAGPRRHRYAETAASRLKALRARREGLS
jgi:hypothetical protein